MNSSREIIYGTRAITEAVEAGKEFEKLLIQKGLRNELSVGLINQLKTLRIQYQEVPLDRLNRITRKNHQGVIGYLSAITYSSIDHILARSYDKGQDPLIVILDRVTDVRNFGAVARSADCMGAHGIIIPSKGSAMINGDAIKTSTGALHHLPVCRVTNLGKAIRTLQENGVYILAFSEKAEDLIIDIQLDRPIGLLLGGEEKGIRPELIKQSDRHCKIPMKGKVSSLNVSVATGMALFEAQRQRGFR